ncbi:MAG TPA: response regulator [Verrucomicrobiae bacterium]|nr:response regulator [Verrucomicrobiae bacterium]
MNPPVLLVEDYQNDVLLLRHFWKSEGLQHPLVEVRHGVEAMDYLMGEGIFANRKLYPLPCLMLLDLKMPMVTGLDVLKQIRRQPGLKMLPVIVFSASAVPKDVDEAYQIGASAFLLKPSGAAEFAALVRLIRDFWLGTNRLPRVGGAESGDLGIKKKQKARRSRSDGERAMDG